MQKGGELVYWERDWADEYLAVRGGDCARLTVNVGRAPMSPDKSDAQPPQSRGGLDFIKGHLNVS